MSQQDHISVPDAIPFDPSLTDPMAWTANPAQPGQIIDEIRCEVYPDQEYQNIDGMAGSFSELGGDALGALPEDLRREALGRLFDPSQGGLTWARTPIGASDFGRDAYSLNDNPGDLGMEKFSIDRDRESLLPFIQGALEWHKDLKIHASPWSPPAWMKSHGEMTRGGHLLEDEEYRGAYALYLLRYIEAYAGEGVEVHRLCQQNETDVPTPYPSCSWSPRQMVDFTVDYLAPTLGASAVSTEIWAGTFRMVCGLDSHVCLADESFRTAVAGVGFQYSFTDNIRDLRHLYPSLPLMHTESVCHEGANSWEQAAMLFDDIVAYLRSGCGLYTYWNMVLDRGGFSTWFWRQNSLIRVDTEKGEYCTTPDYDVMKLFSRHLVPGSKRVEAFSFQRRVLAVNKPSGQVVVFVAHHGATPITLRLSGPKGDQVLELAPRSFNAIEL